MLTPPTVEMQILELLILSLSNFLVMVLAHSALEMTGRSAKYLKIALVGSRIKILN
jgi:hypothetical protein